jgi:hypothetical protein
MTPEEIEAIVLAEYKYWRAAAAKSDDDTVEWIAAGCMAATANILCAIHGHQAPWHPKPKGHKYCPDPDHCTFSDCPTAFCDRDKP